ncbi:hypothetical protein PCC7418_0230 [Halothece sp. PCC 7418]|uniref:DUF3119 family protein n=1 Tax=Halothece sp. (strain PCC 7418) TaxID=65093 RepID=UPI0002A0766F|nr:DUF3119 family protein [Halothece sp. PCC 7418]AFZ42467.1 hypothetical protein PCC7418_0230 [Halothece sp. PCC 7418]
MTSSTSSQQTVTLSPDYRLSVAIFAIGLVFIFLGNSLLLGSKLFSVIAIILGIIISLFSFFLMLQTVIIRLQFTETSLDVYRSEKRIRQFPYSDWLNWEFFWQPVPILFYFREVKSIHFVPFLFNPKQLKQCLEEKVNLQK